MTRREKVAAFLRGRGQEGATNGEIARATGIEPLQLVFNITNRMLARGDVRARRLRDTGRWHFTWRRGA
jgi:hypothetical protein